MISKPIVEDRREQPYVGIRTQLPMGKMRTVIKQLLAEVSAWMKRRGIKPAGPPFTRFHVINMAATMDIEVGFPVANAVQGDDRVSAGLIPAGRYASLIYTGNGIKANGVLLEWAAAQGIQWDRWEVGAGDAFGARIETYLNNPGESPKPEKWKTEVAIRMADAEGKRQDAREAVTAKSNQRDQPESNLPAELAVPARRALAAAGCLRLEQVAKLTAEDVKRLHGIGPKALRQLRHALHAQGLSFADENR